MVVPRYRSALEDRRRKQEPPLQRRQSRPVKLFHGVSLIYRGCSISDQPMMIDDSFEIPKSACLKGHTRFF